MRYSEIQKRKSYTTNLYVTIEYFFKKFNLMIIIFYF